MQGGRRPADSPWDAGDRQVRGGRREKREIGASAKASLLNPCAKPLAQQHPVVGKVVSADGVEFFQ